MPPGSSLSTPNLLFEYEYYGDDQVFFKKMPDQDTIHYVYNDRDLLSYIQDGERKLDNLWYTKVYDDFGRIIIEGLEDDEPGTNNSFANATVEDTLMSLVYGTSGVEIDKLISQANKLLSTPEIITTQMEYDTCGRITKEYGNTLLQIEDDSSHVVQYSYDGADNITLLTQTTKDAQGDQNQLQFRNKYDFTGRHFEEYATVDTFAEQFLCNKVFDEKDLVSQMKLGGSVGSPIQQVDYSYLPNQFLEKINDPASPGSDLFAMQLHYDTPYSGTSPTVRKNGDIINTVWKVKDRNLQVYSFEYDYINRITSSDYNEPNNGSADDRYNTSYSYDNRGNITTLTRYGGYDDGGSISYGQIDNMSYSYVSNSNKIESISEGAPFNGGYQGSANDYTYDSNGSVTYDPSRDADIIRNLLNLPDTIRTDSNELRLYYDAGGLLHRKTGQEDTLFTTKRDYIGQMEFLNGALDFIHHSNGYMRINRGLEEEHMYLSGTQDQDSIFKPLTIQSNQYIKSPADVEYRVEDHVLFHPEFKVDTSAEFLSAIDTFPPSGVQYFFALKDHLGTNRLVFMDEDGNGSIDTSEIFSENHQYPFGMDFYGPFYERNSTFNYKYNAKELVEEFSLGFYNYGARFYDPSVGRFLSLDRFAEKYVFQSPSTYAANNPIKFIDVNGDSIKIKTGDDEYAYYKDGNVYNVDGSQYTGSGVKLKKDGTVKLKGNLKRTVNALNSIFEGGTAGNELISSLVNSESTVTITPGKKNNAIGLNVGFNPSDTDGGLDIRGGTERPAFIGLSHELVHAKEFRDKIIDYGEWFTTPEGKKVLRAEIGASNYENRIRAENNVPLRAYQTTTAYPDAALLNGYKAKYPTRGRSIPLIPRREIRPVTSNR